ncbi:MAG: hypothetical protein JWN86_3295 [Planctomycetota bacterium]|nr:hypothetical protein [Planctomycetota bacterium]
MSAVFGSLRRMKRRNRLFLLAVVLLAIPLGFSARSGEPEKADDLVVHEWGTFLAMNGSDGVSLEGMYHEEHALPGFVHARSRDQLRLPSVSLKGETPVIYFYTDTPRKVRVDVKFPRGIWTQWYPRAQIVGPQFAQMPSASELKDGRIRWCADLIPAGTKDVTLPTTSKDALWNFTRDVDAAYVQTANLSKDPATTETERFLFYRGLGRAPLPLKFAAADGGTLALDSSDRFGLAHVFVIRVEAGQGVYSYRPALRPGEKATGVVPSMKGAKPLDAFTTELADDLAARLVESGLFAKEARAMVNTWRSSYFQTPGVRVLFVLPQAWTDEFIPLTIEPQPRKTVRIMVGRTELLTPERERLVEDAVRDLASTDSPRRQRAFSTLRAQGRYAEPIVRRVLGSTGDAGVRSLCKQLLTAEYVTELKTAIHGAAKGGDWLADDPIHVRAQLAALLHDVGLDSQARAEGKAVLESLRGKPAPAFTHAEFRGYARASARAMEACEDDRGASASYETFVRFGAQALTTKECRFCHHDAGPESASWFRSWWAGPKYASFVARTEGLDAAIDRLSQATPDPATRLRLAYLLEARKRSSQADVIWRELEKSSLPPLVTSAGASR